MDRMFSSKASCLSSHSKCFYNSAMVLPTWPNSNLFQSSNLTLHRSKHVVSEKSESIAIPSSHASWTTSSHRGSFSHIDSNRKTCPTFRLWALLSRCKDKRRVVQSQKWGGRVWQQGRVPTTQLQINSIQPFLNLNTISSLVQPSEIWSNKAHIFKIAPVNGVHKISHLLSWPITSSLFLRYTCNLIKVANN